MSPSPALHCLLDVARRLLYDACWMSLVACSLMPAGCRSSPALRCRRMSLVACSSMPAGCLSSPALRCRWMFLVACSSMPAGCRSSPALRCRWMLLVACSSMPAGCHPSAVLLCLPDVVHLHYLLFIHSLFYSSAPRIRLQLLHCIFSPIDL